MRGRRMLLGFRGFISIPIRFFTPRSPRLCVSRVFPIRLNAEAQRIAEDARSEDPLDSGVLYLSLFGFFLCALCVSAFKRFFRSNGIRSLRSDAIVLRTL
jgi:hypothetical protein